MESIAMTYRGDARPASDVAPRAIDHLVGTRSVAGTSAPSGGQVRLAPAVQRFRATVRTDAFAPAPGTAPGGPSA